MSIKKTRNKHVNFLFRLQIHCLACYPHVAHKPHLSIIILLMLVSPKPISTPEFKFQSYLLLLEDEEECSFHKKASLSPEIPLLSPFFCVKIHPMTQFLDPATRPPFNDSSSPKLPPPFHNPLPLCPQAQFIKLLLPSNHLTHTPSPNLLPPFEKLRNHKYLKPRYSAITVSPFADLKLLVECR